MARDVPKQIARWARDHFLFTAEVDDRDPAFSWLRSWLGIQAASSSTWISAGVAADFESEDYGNRFGRGKAKPAFYMSPRGWTLFHYRGRRFVTWSKRNDAGPSRTETITVQSWRGNKQLIEAMLGEAYDLAAGRDGQRVEVWVPDREHWRLLARKRVRPISTLCLPPQASGILADAREFLSSHDWYVKMGIPHRRGYLFQGPPGNGKSSLAHALASELGVNINVANLSSFSSDDSLMSCLSRVAPGNILLLEDVDAAYSKREANDKSPSFPALLNSIDGICAQDGRIIIMTTNHVDKLDPALIRPGRADVHVLIGNSDIDQAMDMFLRFFPGENAPAAKFGGWVVDASWSMARIQEHLLVNRGSCRHACQPPSTAEMRDLVESLA